MFSSHLVFLEEGDFKEVEKFYDLYHLEDIQRTDAAKLPADSLEKREYVWHHDFCLVSSSLYDYQSGSQQHTDGMLTSG